MRVALPSFVKAISSWLLIAVAPIMLGWAAHAAPANPMSAVGLAQVRFGGDDSTTRVVLDLDAPVTGRDLASEGAASRLVFGLPAVLSVGATSGAGRGLVRAWSIGGDSRGARLVLDVKPGAVATKHFLLPPASLGAPWRYVIDVSEPDAKGDRPTLASASAAVPTAQPAGYPAAPSDVRLISANPPPNLPTRVATGFAAYSAWASARAGVAQTSSGSAGQANSADVPPISAPRAAAPVASRTVPGARTAAVRSVAARPKVIVIDAGHGGHDPGARSLVRNEKDITLAAAKSLKALLEKSGRYKVVLTRDTDIFIPLESRVQIARRAGADLFISLHADSAGSDPTPHGASIYTLSDSGQNRVNYVLKPSDWLSKGGDHRTDAGVRQILLDLTQRSTRNRSSEFASLLIDHISDRVDMLPRSHRDAGYFVLLAPDVPAVLLEMGFITNPGDEMRLTDPAQRENLMAGVADAIDAYFTGGTRLAQTPPKWNHLGGDDLR
jgi:N-acetylmuramoyl-L-alanine amidase